MLDSEEKDPTCVVKILECLRPVSQRTSTSNIGVRRGSSVATKLHFEDSRISQKYSNSFRSPANYSSKKRFLDASSSKGTQNKLAKIDIQELAAPASPWAYRLLQADLIKAKSHIEVLENSNKQLHALRRKQEQVFENEKGALKLQHEVSENQVKILESRIDVLTQRSHDFKTEIFELKAKLRSDAQNSCDKLQSIEKAYATLQSELSEAQMKAADKRLSWNTTKLESELATANDLIEKYKLEVATLESQQEVFRLDKKKSEILEKELQDSNIKLMDMKYEQSNNIEAIAMAKAQQAKLMKYSEIEQELGNIKEDNRKLRVLVQNKLLLEEKVTSLQTRLANADERDTELLNLREVKKNLEISLEEWMQFAKVVTNGKSTRLAQVKVYLDQLQQRELQLNADLGEIRSKLRVTTEAKKSTALELEDLKKVFDKQKSMHELQMNCTHRINKKLQLVTMERNSYRTQLDAYEREMTMPSTAALMHSQHEQQRSRIDSLEKALEGYRELVTKLEADIDKDKKDLGSRTKRSQETESLIKLEAEKLQLEQINKSLQQKCEELDLELQFRHLKGDYNPTKSKVLHCRMNPQAEAEGQRNDELDLLRAECTRLREKNALLKEGLTQNCDLSVITDERLKTSNSAEVQELRGQVKSYDLKIQRLKDAFKVTSNEFRELVYTVLGYRIDRKTSHEYHLSSMYADSPDDILTFKYNSLRSDVDLIETPFSKTLESLIDLHLRGQHSIPVFLSAVTLDLFSQQTISTTIAVPTE